MKKEQILLSTATIHDEEMVYLKDAFDRGYIACVGFNCDSFESEMANYLNERNDTNFHTLATASGTAALHLAFKLAGVKRGEKVFCSDVTFAATINPAIYEGAVPVFIDSEADSWNMDPVALEKAFEKYPDVRVVALVHLYGSPAKTDEIIEICNKHNAILIEDAAEALSATYKGKKCGTFGKYNAISFNGNKIITTSGGGMLLTSTQADRQKAFFWANQSKEPAPWYQHEEIGYNYRMSNVVAGIGRGQLLHLDEHKELKKNIYMKYKDGLKDLPLSMNPYLDCTEPNFWLSCILIDKDCPVTPEKIRLTLEEKNIESRPIWKPMHMQPVFSGCDFITAQACPVGEDIFARGLCLPSDIKMTEEIQAYVIDIIKSCF